MGHVTEGWWVGSVNVGNSVGRVGSGPDLVGRVGSEVWLELVGRVGSGQQVDGSGRVIKK